MKSDGGASEGERTTFRAQGVQRDFLGRGAFCLDTWREGG